MTTEQWTPERIRALRERLHLSQEQLSARLHVAFSTVNRWERGHSVPRWHLARLLDELEAEASRD